MDLTQYTETGINESLEERQTLLEELKTEYLNLLDKEKPDLIFVQNDSDVVEGMTLEELLRKHGPFPLEEHIAAGILRSVSSAIMFLHSREIVHGGLDFTSAIIDSRFRAKTIITTTLYQTKHSKYGARAKVEDVFHLGLLLYRMVTGRKAEFGKDGELVGGPSPYLRVSEKGLKLAEFMLTKSKRFPPTIGRVRYSEWLEECEENPPVFVIFPDYV
ncbi:hypothetical protein NECAME_15605 [Necator americanus]|uniref:Protein kinase domain-containing protein n=1 Tax=Necator americanus TaxID=51031 RepID=W2SGV3_NECAM|nr:hypothetical protein NECAME_15605 [Necator americanus]ETN68820.1 hypothetical protein NECAME_15605 [Necator americanus]